MTTLHGSRTPSSGSASNAACARAGLQAPRIRYGSPSTPSLALSVAWTSISDRTPNPSWDCRSMSGQLAVVLGRRPAYGRCVTMLARSSPWRIRTAAIQPPLAAFLRRSRTSMPEGPLIGRESELLALEQALASARLVTIAGAGGCGKTRVALELLGRVRARGEPIDSRVVELAIVRSADHVVDAFLRAFDARERAGRTQMEVLVQSLAGRRTVLVIDNCEHVAGEVARVVTSLVDVAPELRVLVTSREPLGVSDEVVFGLSPLGLPEASVDVAAVVRSDAGRFFVDRAAAADRNFALTPSTARSVVRICHQLDGLPLALGLAAARVGNLSAGEIADGLSRHGRLTVGLDESALPQHRSVRASLDWSYDLLDELERV